jgi:hypothetical protein
VPWLETSDSIAGIWEARVRERSERGQRVRRKMMNDFNERSRSERSRAVEKLVMVVFPASRWPFPFPLLNRKLITRRVALQSAKKQGLEIGDLQPLARSLRGAFAGLAKRTEQGAGQGRAGAGQGSLARDRTTCAVLVI